jgi:DNA-binding MarR family transcriptional regulator
MMPPVSEPLPPDQDLSLLCAAVAAGLNDEIHRRLAQEGHGELRDHHGYLFQHLIEGPQAVGELARRLGITQQAVSKTATELERLGYIWRTADAGDQRVRRIELSDRAWDAIDRTRRTRRTLNHALREHLGDRRWSSLLTALRSAADNTGALDTLRDRRLRPTTWP